MNKIYNNLSIDNLLETELYKDFNLSQKDEIRKGLEKGLDVSVYANPDFSVEQMREIAIGLIEDLDVSKYAKPEITVEEMKVIIEELRNEKLRVW